MRADDCCILNSGGGSWAFATLARQLSDALWVDVAEAPRRYNYLLLADDSIAESDTEFFIPFASMRLAADKRLLASAFAAHGVPTPETRLIGSTEDAENLMLSDISREWCLKFPTGCGASGHRLLTVGATLPEGWPMPLVVQEFIRLNRPEVYRLYGAGQRLFGWIARRFPAGAPLSPWVAHVRGARYELAGDPPPDAVDATRSALEATGLLDSFGCADLLRTPNRKWVVLEVGTDGMFNHVDRELGNSELERAIQRNIAEAFWGRFGTWRPWGAGEWYTRPQIDTRDRADTHRT